MGGNEGGGWNSNVLVLVVATSNDNPLAGSGISDEFFILFGKVGKFWCVAKWGCFGVIIPHFAIFRV